MSVIGDMALAAAQQDVICEQRERIAELVEALRPFANGWRAWEKDGRVFVDIIPITSYARAAELVPERKE